MLKKITAYIPLLAVLLIVLGLCKQFIYYTNFNVPINSFIGLSEIGILISDDLIINIPFFASFIAIISAVDFDIKSNFEVTEPTKTLESKPVISIKQKNRKALRSVIGIGISCIVFYFGLGFITNTISNLPEYYEQVSWSIFT
jgi:hypothetical protein